MERIRDILRPATGGIPASCVTALLFAFVFAGIRPTAEAQNTVGLIRSDPRACPGYTLFAPIMSTSAFLIDNEGRLVHRWDGTYMPGLAVYLLENGNLIRMCRTNPADPEGGGRIEEVDWEGNLVWSLNSSQTPYEFHHDIAPMPNGNFLVVARETKSKEEAIAAGRDPRYFTSENFLPDLVIELKPDGHGSAGIVWEWHFWDHMSSAIPGEWKANGRPVGKDIADPGKLDINYVTNGNPDWLHCNAVDYNAALDQVVLSGHSTGELYVISHATADYADIAAGIEAARGPAGDFLYRWGNAAVYVRGPAKGQKLFGQHDVQWIAEGLPGEGNFLVFNNGLFRYDGPYSTVEEIVPPLREDGTYALEEGKPYAPENPLWLYRAPKPADFYSKNISGAQRLPNGNTLVCEGARGRFFEVTPSGEIVWEYINPVNDSGAMQQGAAPERNSVFLCRRYPREYPAFAGRDLTPGDPIERYTTEARFPRSSHGMDLSVAPNPARSDIVVRFTLETRCRVSLKVFDALGRETARLADGVLPPGMHTRTVSTTGLRPGVYFVRFLRGKETETAHLVVSR
ncbi:MAG: aryl-sulfate sulfotransferase [Bacteroidota bacterium]|nr:aryl-sulfate sulfotransferase [Bacteroidota bacterium]